jgi:peptidoglycan hydrolase-like protein with peptidoglycan-binding domain
MRAGAEAVLGQDFSQVRVHSGRAASRSAAAVGAGTFTVGRDIVLGATAGPPDSPEVLQLITHELVHVAQDGRPYRGGPLRLGGSADPEEAVADAVVSRYGRAGPVHRTAGAGPEPTLRRKPIEESVPGSRPNLDFGDSGPAVTLLQRLLGIKTTGRFDERTRRAVVRFQQEYDPPSLHPATGGVGPLTWQALDERVQRSGKEQGQPGARPNLELGDTGTGVALLQRLLGRRPTGVFDDATERAVIAYQEARPELHPATGGVGPKTWQALDRHARQGRLVVGGSVVGDVSLSFASAGTVLTGATEVARGPATFNGVALAGGAPLVLFTGGTQVAATVTKAAAAFTDVASTSAEAIAIANRIQVQLLRQAATTVGAGTGVATGAGTVATGTTTTVVVGTGLAAVGAVGAGLAAGVGIALLPVAAAYAASVAARLGDTGGTSLPGGLPTTPAVDPGRPAPASAPGADAGAPSLLPGAAGPGAAHAPGESSHPVVLAGLRIPLEQSRAERLEKAEKAEKWTDLPGPDRRSLGKAYNHIVESMVRELAGGGRAAVLHYAHVTKELVEELRKKGGRVVITEGRLMGGSRRFDIAEIDFTSGRVELIDLTALGDPRHVAKNYDYADGLGRVTGFPVAAYEARYVDDNRLSDEIVIVPIPSK